MFVRRILIAWTFLFKHSQHFSFANDLRNVWLKELLVLIRKITPKRPDYEMIQYYFCHSWSDHTKRQPGLMFYSSLLPRRKSHAILSRLLEYLFPSNGVPWKVFIPHLAKSALGWCLKNGSFFSPFSTLNITLLVTLTWIEAMGFFSISSIGSFALYEYSLPSS